MCMVSLEQARGCPVLGPEQALQAYKLTQPNRNLDFALVVLTLFSEGSTQRRSVTN